MDIRLLAIKIGDYLKYGTTLNEIDRKGGAIFRFSREEFPVDGITSSRARRVYDWLMSLAKQKLSNEERQDLIAKFCLEISPEDQQAGVISILKEFNIPIRGSNSTLHDFLIRGFHPKVVESAKKLFGEGNYSHCLLEVAKIYNSEVRAKAQSPKDGQDLMLDVWSADRGVLKVTQCKTDTDKSIQEGLKFMSAGLIRAIRNPAAHEPTSNWNLPKEECLEVLSIASFLFRQLDKSVYFKS